jgi:hypothetical protein
LSSPRVYDRGRDIIFYIPEKIKSYFPCRRWKIGVHPFVCLILVDVITNKATVLIFAVVKIPCPKFLKWLLKMNPYTYLSISVEPRNLNNAYPFLRSENDLTKL